MYKKQLLKSVIQLMIAVLLCSNLSLAYAKTTFAKTTTLTVKEQGDLWVSELANQPEFAKWAEAETTLSPLGPGTHSWLMLIKHAELGTIGYMIIHSDGKGGYELGEYGLGSNESLQNLSANRYQLLYYNPFHTVISQQEKKKNNYFDPFNGEHYEISSKYLIDEKLSTAKQIRHGIPFAHALLTGYELQSYFAPYEVMPWLTTTSLNAEFEDCTSIETLIELGSQLRYTSSVWNDTIEFIYSVTGYHEWELTYLYIALQQDDEQLKRFIPYDYLMEHGNFYDPALSTY